MMDIMHSVKHCTAALQHPTVSFKAGVRGVNLKLSVFRA